MEGVEEPPLNHASVDAMKVTVVVDEGENTAVASVKSDVCHKSNGVTEPSETTNVATSQPSIVPSDHSVTNNELTPQDVISNSDVVEPISTGAVEADTTSIQPEVSSPDQNQQPLDQSVDNGEKSLKINDVEEICSDSAQLEESVVEMDSTIELSTDRVTFETEIFIEPNDNEVIDAVSSTKEDKNTSSILGELEQNIEFSEALCASDVTENMENNNCSGGQEVFNNEELLDILEGNDGEQSALTSPKTQKRKVDKLLETQLALEQLSRLKKKSKKSRTLEKPIKVRKSEVKPKEVIKQEPDKSLEDTKVDKKEESLVKSLVQEWDDEDATDNEKANKLLEESEKFLQTTTELVKIQEAVEQKKGNSVRTSIDSNAPEDTPPTLNKSCEEGQPQRRLGRVIKKKVIFDPDNPDTFTKSLIKSKEHGPEKELVQPKKIKIDPDVLRAKSKSPLSKLQWKKPTPKSSQSKQNKRLTEVDKLLMDEGAVNMIYQLTPEAPKGKKNMKTKAEFIKKLQSSTPDTKEMKFRERKKESKYEEGDPKKILGGKQRHSLSSSVKSPSVSEDFEAHSADDSIIYRRHSSSSYSSSCMSPRRLSDVEAGTQTTRNATQAPDNHNKPSKYASGKQSAVDGFMSENIDLGTETINKSDCLSIKEKLNSKLNLALKKRKKESKLDKPSKQKKLVKSDENINDFAEKLKYLSVSFESRRLAQINVLTPDIKCDVAVMQEFQKALAFINTLDNISVTLLTSECVTTCSNLDLTSLLEDNLEKRTGQAYEIAESIRCMVQEVGQHSKLLCTGTLGASGAGLALLALSDVVLASERGSFGASLHSTLLEPGLGVLSSLNILPQQLLNDMIVFGRRLSASEALQGGLVSRTLWPENFNLQVQNIVKDITSQPAQNILLKKQMLNMKKSGSESTFLSCLEKERDLLIQYWTSAEGQKILHAVHNSA